MSDLRSELIRLASKLPKGSAERTAVLDLVGSAKVAVSLESPAAWRVSDAGEAMLDYAGYTGESHHWNGMINGEPVSLEIEIDLRGVGELHVRWGGMHWESALGIRNINALRKWAQLVYDWIKDKGLTPSSIEWKGRQVFHIARR